jgi:outer membrane biosynthesis protein TonB
MKDKQQISFALGGSVLAHLLLAGGVTTILAFGRVSPPDNDHFERARELQAGEVSSGFGDNHYATREVFEPVHAQTSTGGSVWWNWRAGQSGEVELNVIARDFEEVVGVYRGAVLETLVEVASREAGNPMPVRFSAQEGQSYYVAVAGSGKLQEGRIAVDIAIGDDDEQLVLLVPEMFVVDEAEEEDLPKELGYVRTRDVSEKAPDDARFESDQNTLAASEVMPDENGEEDVPNVSGEDLPFGDLVSSDFTDGEFRNEDELPVTAIQEVPPEIAPKKPAVLAGELKTQAAGKPGKAQQEEGDLAVAEEQFHDIKHEVSADEKISGRELTPIDPAGAVDGDRPTGTEEVAESLKEEDEVVENKAGEREQLQPQEVNSPAFQTHAPKKQLAGKLSNIGTAAIDVAETPLGHYKKKVDQAVQRSWHRARIARGDFAKYGSLKVRFWIDRSGKIVELKVVRNNADPVMLDFSISGIRNALLPPVPEELIKRTQDERMEFDYEIIIY